MASFIPNHRKKKERLRHLKDLLRRLLAKGASEEKLRAAAVQIRDGRIRALRAMQNHNPERTPQQRADFLKLQAEIDALKSVSAESVLAEYRRQ
jgi:hypothetical protein